MASRRSHKGNKLDINTASVDELAKLNGIGPTKAESIVEQREALGSFTSVRDLLSIPGIGPSLLDQNRSVLMCSRQPHAAKDVPSTDRETRSHTRSENYQQGCSTSTTTSNMESSNTTSSKAKADVNKNSANNNRDSTITASARTAEKTDKSDNNKTNANESGDSAVIEYEGSDAESESVLQGERSDPERCEQCGEERMDCGDGSSDSEADQHRGQHRHNSECAHCGCHHDTEMDSGDDISRPSRRPRSPLSFLEKHWMKRKCEGVDSKAMTPGKKLCRTDSDDQSSSCCCDTDNITSSNALPGISRQAMRKRITSRTNPPPELADWIKTFQSWSSAERLVALDEMIEVCEPTQVRHMMAVIEPQFQRDFISLLPKELALYVLSFLEPRDLLRAAQTCRYWRILAEDNLLWREKCREESIDEALVFGNRVRRRSESSSRSPWKSLYMRQKTIEFNWRSFELRPPKVLKGHDDHVITCLEFSAGKIVSGSDDNTLKVWSATTGKCLRTLVGHTGGVWSSQMADNLIISGSTDRTLKVWNADTGLCIHTLYGHTSTVRCMHLHGNKVVSGSRDATLRMWDMDSGQCLHVLMGHVAAVRCVQYDGRRVVSGAYDYMVKVWDPETETCLHTLQGHTNRVYSLQFDGVHIVSGSLDTSIRVWDVESGNCLHTLIGHQSLTSGMELKDNILVSGNADSTVKVWDITTGQCLQTLQGPNKHLSAVTCLQFNKRFVITSSDDGSVKIWDVKTGDFLRNLVALDSGGSGGVVWRIRCNNTKLVCAVGSRNGTEETKLMVLDFDVEDSLTNWGTVCCGKTKMPS